LSKPLPEKAVVLIYSIQDIEKVERDPV